MEEIVEIKAELARLEERIIALDEKADLYHDQSKEAHQGLSEKVCRIATMVEETLKRQQEVIFQTKDKVNELVRDRAWMIAIFGLFWGLMIAYIEWRGHKG